VRGRRALLPSLIAGLLALLVILIAIPVTVVSSYIPAGVTGHKLLWIGLLAAAALAIVVLTVQAAWPAIRVRGRLQARYSRLVRRFGGDKNPGAKKKAITAIAHTLLKIAYQVLQAGTPYQEPGADFYTRRESPQQRQAFLQRQLQKLHPGCTITITISPPEAAWGA
jgi:hypothetical protein